MLLGSDEDGGEAATSGTLANTVNTLHPSVSFQPTESGISSAPTINPVKSNIFDPPIQLSNEPTTEEVDNPINTMDHHPFSTPAPVAVVTNLDDTAVGYGYTNITHDDMLEHVDQFGNMLSMVHQPVESIHGCPQSGSADLLFDEVISDFWCGGSGTTNPTPTLVLNIGPSLITGIRVFAATDCPNCDPISFLLESYSDDDDSWKLIASGSFDDAWSEAGILDPPERNPKFASTFGDSRLSMGYVDFAAAYPQFVGTIYSRYRLTFPDLRGSNRYNYFKLGELQLLGGVLVGH